MHEMSLCESVLQIMEAQARSQGFSRVHRVRLEIGALAGVELEAMRFGFEVVTRGTLADGAVLEIIELPGRAWCLECSRQVAVDRRYDPCPGCGGYSLRVTGGDELRIKDLEVD
jgi:hydrogenase nickel incorporation protein HypA/HybF